MTKYAELLEKGWIDTKVGFAFNCVILEKVGERILFDKKNDKISLQYKTKSINVENIKL